MNDCDLELSLSITVSGVEIESIAYECKQTTNNVLQ